MFRKVVIVIVAGSILAACGYSRNIPRSWRPVTIEEKGLKWAVKLCHQFGYTELGSEERRKCIAEDRKSVV